MSICAFVPLIFVATLIDTLSPPPPPMLIWVVPAEFLRAKPPELEA